MITCEVCVEGLPGALAAAEGGAHRIELCAGLVEGGTTPSPGALKLVLERVPVDTVVLVRPRGGDFLYSSHEMDTILMDVEAARSAGAFGVATGVLTPDGSVDEAAMKAIMDVAGPMSVTFHRAFDMLRDPWDALEILVGLGVDRILTSGRQRSVPEGLSFIREAMERAEDRIAIMPGGGLNRGNVHEIIRATGVRQVHFTAFKRWESPMAYRNLRPLMGADGLPGEYERITTDPEKVREMLREVGKAGAGLEEGPVRKTPGSG